MAGTCGTAGCKRQCLDKLHERVGRNERALQISPTARLGLTRRRCTTNGRLRLVPDYARRQAEGSSANRDQHRRGQHEVPWKCWGAVGSIAHGAGQRGPSSSVTPKRTDATPPSAPTLQTPTPTTVSLPLRGFHVNSG